MDYLDDVPEDKIFILGDKKIKNLYGLLFEFREINDETYQNYVTDDHNYFADWVEYVVKDKDLAEKLRAARPKKDAINVLEFAVDSIRREKEPKRETKKIVAPSVQEKSALKSEIEEKPAQKTEKKIVQMQEEKKGYNFPKEEKDAKIFLWKHFGSEMAKEFMYGLAFGILMGLIFSKMFLR